MEPAVVDALAAGVSATAFLVGFGSVRLRSQRDRALAQSDEIAKELLRSSRNGSGTSDAEVQAASRAFGEASQADPIGRWTVLVVWLVLTLMVVLLWVEGLLAFRAFFAAPSEVDVLAVPLFLVALEVAVVILGTADYFWVKRDLRDRLAGSLVSVPSRFGRPVRMPKPSRRVTYWWVGRRAGLGRSDSGRTCL